MKHSNISLMLLALALGLGGAARADLVRMRSGKVIEGVLGSVDKGKVRLWMGPAQISVPVEQVASITTDTLGVNTLIDARFRLEGRRLEDGAEKLGLAVRQGAPPERVGALLTAHADALADGLAQLSQAARDGLSLALAAQDGLAGAPGGLDPPRRLLLHVALGESARGEAVLNALGQDYFAQRPAEAARLSAMLERSLENWSQAEDFARGQTVLQMLQRIDPRRGEGAAIQFYLQWGSVERRDGRYESALRIYTRNLMGVSPPIARDRIEKALKEAEQALRVKGRPMEAAPLYEAYGLPAIPAAARERLAQVWHDEGWARLWENRVADARAAFAVAVKYKKDCAAGCAAKDLAQCEWRERRARLAKDDFKGRLELGEWCERQELFPQAIVELREALRSPELLAQADAKIQSIQSRMAEADLARIMGLYEIGEYAKVLLQVDEFMRREPSPGFLAQAKQIEDMTREALRLRTASRPQQAESLYEQAQRAFYQEDYTRAQGLLDTIARHYPDTVTQPRAGALAALVNQKLEVAALEAGRKPAPSAADPTSATLPAGKIAAGTRSTIKNWMADAATSGVANAPVRIPRPAPGPTPRPANPPARAETPNPVERQTINDALRKIIREGGQP